MGRGIVYETSYVYVERFYMSMELCIKNDVKV